MSEDGKSFTEEAEEIARETATSEAVKAAGEEFRRRVTDAIERAEKTAENFDVNWAATEALKRLKAYQMQELDRVCEMVHDAVRAIREKRR